MGCKESLRGDTVLMDKLVILRRRKLGMSSAKGIADVSKTGIRWVRNDQANQPKEDEVVIRWGCTSNVVSKNVLNTAKAIHEVNNKGAFRSKCAEAKLSPATWFNAADVPPYTLAKGVIVRPNSHAQGRHVYLCHTSADLDAAVRRCGVGYYISEYIRKTHEYRVYVVSGRAVAVAEKIPKDVNDVAWNHALGGEFKNVRWDSWNLKCVRYAIEAMSLTDLDFGGVDVMCDDDNNVYIIEINTAPSLTTPYRQSCFAKAFDYIAEHGKQTIPLVNKRGGYKKFIHPAINNEALVL